MQLTDRQLEIIATCLELATEYGNGDGEISSVALHLQENLGDWFEDVHALQRAPLRELGGTLDDDHEAFLRTLDGMIESTEEFIRDDGLRVEDSRIHDLSALLRTREVFEAHHG